MLFVCRPAAPKGKQNEFHPVGREKVNCRMAAREAGLGHDLGAPNLAPGRSVAFMETTGEGLTSPAPPPPGSGSKTSRRDVIANQIFPQYVDKFVCGRGQPRPPPAGVIRKRGRSAPSCVPAPRRRTFPPVKRGHSRPPFQAKSPRARTARPYGAAGGTTRTGATKCTRLRETG